jgi:hypothetical protein
MNPRNAANGLHSDFEAHLRGLPPALRRADKAWRRMMPEGIVEAPMERPIAKAASARLRKTVRQTSPETG